MDVSELFDPDPIFDPLLEFVFEVTVHPITVDELEKMYDASFHKNAFKETLKDLRCTSFNHLIRIHRKRFKPFLMIFIRLDGELYYVNKPIQEKNTVPNHDNKE